MKFHFATVMLATLAMVANSSLHQLQNPPASSPSLPPSSTGESPSPSSSSAPGPSVDCFALVLDDMTDCTNYLLNFETKVTASCCSGFESVVEIAPNCICEGLKKSIEEGFDVNMTRAKHLPHICKVTLPPNAQSCNVSPTPGAGPVGPPDSSSPEFPPEEPPTSPSTEPPTSPSTEPPSEGSAPSTTPGGSPSISAPSPSKGGAYSVSISFFGLISLLLGSLLV